MGQPPSPSTILIVEDEAKLAAVLVDYLHAWGYVTHCVADGREVTAAVRAHRPDLILLDLMLPGRDGLTVCKEVRAFSDTPIIMITARVDEIDRLLGLELGADDYVCKPFSPREVVARVKAVLRRVQRARDDPPPASRLTIDEATFAATFDGHALDLTPVEFRLLNALASSPGAVFSRSRLLDQLYADHRIVTDRTVDSHVKNLRRKLGEASGDEDVIHSVYGVGYRLEL